MNEQRTIEFLVSRCWECGSFWAIESFRQHGTNMCPRCAGEKVKRAEAEMGAAIRSARSTRAFFKKKQA